MLNFAKVIVEEDNQSQYGVLSLSTLQSGDPLMDFCFLLSKFVKCVFALTLIFLTLSSSALLHLSFLSFVS